MIHGKVRLIRGEYQDRFDFEKDITIAETAPLVLEGKGKWPTTRIKFPYLYARDLFSLLIPNERSFLTPVIITVDEAEFQEYLLLHIITAYGNLFHITAKPPKPEAGIESQVICKLTLTVHIEDMKELIEKEIDLIEQKECFLLREKMKGLLLNAFSEEFEKMAIFKNEISFFRWQRSTESVMEILAKTYDLLLEIYQNKEWMNKSFK